ncbi:hypothetical protein ElyMa_002674500 [Elysia marginata]|uniref:Uncharacterized protein n=1 Tax=Elysia marginata TaxID=1093978 RepID=A0AAV4H9C0_9GAST|nr:hypothetical protein ElyMa_002674500 [Elysia marginata]
MDISCKYSIVLRVILGINPPCVFGTNTTQGPTQLPIYEKKGCCSPVPKRKLAPTLGVPGTLLRVQAYREHLVQQLGFLTASTPSLFLPSDRIKRRSEAVGLHWLHLPPWLHSDLERGPPSTAYITPLFPFRLSLPVSPRPSRHFYSLCSTASRISPSPASLPDCTTRPYRETERLQPHQLSLKPPLSSVPLVTLRPKRETFGDSQTLQLSITQ